MYYKIGGAGLRLADYKYTITNCNAVPSPICKNTNSLNDKTISRKNLTFTQLQIFGVEFRLGPRREKRAQKRCRRKCLTNLVFTGNQKVFFVDYATRIKSILIIFVIKNHIVRRGSSRKDIFRVIMPCKGYVKAYLLANFRHPDPDWDELVNLSSDKLLHDYFLTLLRKSEQRNDTRLKGTRYHHQVSIEITFDQFQRYGWLLTMTDTMKLNTLLERRVKQMLYAYVGALRITGLPLMDCVRRFRISTGINEWLWDTDSIRKDLQRHLDYDPSIMDDFLVKIEEKVWRTLSHSGTITAQGETIYENHHL